jgi:TonB family protein
MPKSLKSSFGRSFLLHGGLLLLVALLAYHSKQEEVQPIPITLESIQLGKEVKRVFHQVVHSIGIPHDEPDPSDESPTQKEAENFEKSNLNAQSSSPDSGEVAPNELQRYLGEVVSRIHAKKRYPKEALFNEQEGVVLVLLEVSKPGTILRAELEKGCPFPLLNDAALEAVRSIQTLPPIPARHSGESLILHVPIRFRIER